MRSPRLMPVIFILFSLILAALPSATADPMVETSVPDTTIEEDNDAVGIFNLNDHFSSDGGQLYFSAISPDSKLEVVIHDDGLVDISTPEDWYGTDEVTFTATDGKQEARDTISVTVLPVNDRPYISKQLPGEVIFAEDGMAANSVNLYSHFSDVDSKLDFSHTSQNIIISIDDRGDVVFTAPSNWYGSEVITFTASDEAYEATDTMKVTVVPVNDAPRTTGSPGTISLGSELSKGTIDLSNYFADVDDETLDYQVSESSELRFELNDNGNLLFIEAPDDFQGEEVLTITASDSQGATSSVQVMVVAAGSESSSGIMFYSLGLVLALAIAGVRLQGARSRRPPKSPVKLDNYRHYRG